MARGTNSMLKGGCECRVSAQRATTAGLLLMIPRIDGAFLPWSTRLLGVLLEKYPLPNGLMPIPPDQLLPPKWVLELDASVNLDTPADITTHIHVPRPNSLLGTISRNTRVTPTTHWQDVRQITIALPRHVSYVPGDTISLLPKNFSDDVSHLLALQSWTLIADQPLRLVPNPSIPPDRLPPSPITHPVAPLTLRTLLTHHLDITAVPRRSFFAVIACLSTDDTQRERLKEFTDPEYVDELYDYTTRPRRSILEVLQEFNSVHVPLPMILEVLPRLRERQFSIASSQRGCQPPPAGGTTVTPSVDLLVAIVRYRTIIKRMRHGVCTRWLSSLAPGAPLTLVFNVGTLTRADDDWTRPAVMVAPGTGVAPMRALVWERVHRVPEAMGVLFFGARNRDADFFFEGEWPSALKVFTAFSRDQKGKRYVQHVLREHGREVYDALVERRGVLYVCGSSGRMPAAVREALVGVVAEIEDRGAEAAENVVERLEKEGRWREETW